MLLCCLRRHELNVGILLRSLHMTKYFKYFNSLVFIGNLDLCLVIQASSLNAL
jgi:hypothetical protein